MPEVLTYSLQAFAPELVVLITAVFVLLVDLFSNSDSHRKVVSMTMIGVGVAMVTSFINTVPEVKVIHENLDRVMAHDELSALLKAGLCLLTLLALTLSFGSFQEEAQHSGEYYSLILFSLLGGLVVISAQEFLTFFVAFELLSIPLYVLVAFRRYHPPSAEAGLKYFLNGAVSSAVLLFGISWVFGSTGTTQFNLLLTRLEPGNLNPFLAGSVLILAALAFKISAAPFHMWSPDVYQGSPLPVAAFLSTAPKLAMMGFAIRLINLNLSGDVPGSLSFQRDIMMVLAALACISVLVGNLVALVQSNVRRLVAFSGVAQIGYLLTGLMAATATINEPRNLALGAVVFYTLIYTVTNVALWAIILLIEQRTNDETTDAFTGLAKTSPQLAFALFIALLSLAGVPPLAGFIGKVYLFRAAMGVFPMAVAIGIFGSVLSLYYYFGILKKAYFLEPDHPDPVPLDNSTAIFLAICLGGTTVAGLWPACFEFCVEVVTRSFSL